MQNLVFKGLNGQFKIVAATQYITRIKDSTNKMVKFVVKLHWIGCINAIKSCFQAIRHYYETYYDIFGSYLKICFLEI